MSREILLMVADSERNADMLYAVKAFVPDPFIYLCFKGRGHIVIGDLEIDRVREQAPHCRVISSAKCRRALHEAGVRKPGLAHVIRHVLKQRGARRVVVPDHFPFGLAQQLRRLRITVGLKKGPCFPERQTKSAGEIKKLSAALTMAEVGLAEGIQALRQPKIGRDRKLLYRNVPLTAEKLRGIIDTAVLQAGGHASHTIVAGGRQACDPHERGHGTLRGHEPIILDVFPRSQKTGYYGDITRTVVKGRASEPVRRVYHTVARGQEIAFAHMRNGASGFDVHQRVQEFFEQQGYKTGRKGGRMQGFFHSTGHGLGLEVHELPRISPLCDDTLKIGHVVTVEPGLYYTDLGGVRLEDVALIGRRAARNLTQFEKILEI